LRDLLVASWEDGDCWWKASFQPALSRTNMLLITAERLLARPLRDDPVHDDAVVVAELDNPRIAISPE
jgi:hypothetical protein